MRRENIAIKARIDRLEELVYSRSCSLDAEARPSKARRIVHDKTAKTLVSPATTLTDSPQAEIAKNYRRDVRWLEGVGKCLLSGPRHFYRDLLHSDFEVSQALKRTQGCHNYLRHILFVLCPYSTL